MYDNITEIYRGGCKHLFNQTLKAVQIWLKRGILSGHQHLNPIREDPFEFQMSSPIFGHCPNSDMHIQTRICKYMRVGANLSHTPVLIGLTRGKVIFFKEMSFPDNCHSKMCYNVISHITISCS